MQRLGHPGLVRIPEQQVKGGRVLAQQIIADEEGPDQVVGPQGVEGLGHDGAGQDPARRIHLAFDLVQPVLVGEQQQVARLLEVMLGGEEGGGGDTFVTLGRHMRQRGAQQGAADAVSDGVQLFRACLLKRLFDGAVNALLQIVVKAEPGLVQIRIDPRADEDREPLRRQPADQRIPGLQVHDVELVDPRREDQQRDRVLRLAFRRVLNQFEQFIAPDHLTGGRGDILAHDELAIIGLTDPQRAAAALQVGGEVLHSLHQGFAAGLRQRLKRDRVGGQEVRWREGVGQQAGEELGAAFQRGIDILHARDQAVHPVGRQQIGPTHHVEHGVLGPGRVFEPFVGRGGRRRLTACLTRG